MISFTNSMEFNAYSQPTRYSPSFQNCQTSQFPTFNTMTPNCNYGGYNSFSGCNQSQNSGMMTMFASLLSLLMCAKLKNQTPPAPQQQTNQNANLLQGLMSLLGQNNIANTIPVTNNNNQTYTNTGNIGNLYVFEDDVKNINNYGNIGTLNIIQNPFKALLEKLFKKEEETTTVINDNDATFDIEPTDSTTTTTTPAANTTTTSTPATTTVDTTTITVTPKDPEKVFIVGSYGQKSYNLAVDMKNFGAQDRASMFNKSRGLGFGHNRLKANDDELTAVLSKMSEADKKLLFDKGQAYIISEDGEIIDTVSSKQLGDSKVRSVSQQNNDSFKIVDSLGVEKQEEAMGGKIQLSGTTYEVVSTLLRKTSPLTFDLNGDGVKTSDKIVDFDIDGDGKLDKINDVADGTLSIRGGKDGKDLFGDNTDIDGDGKADGFKNGFDALKSLAKKESLINGKDDMVLDAKDIKILEEKYGFGMKTEGYNSKEKSLSELGITEINLGSTDEVTSKDNFDGKDNLLMEQEGTTFKINGKEREYADVWHEIKN